MKAAPFAYVRPVTLDDAVAELADAGEEGKVLAGGQSLVPVLAMRLGRPGVLVDINEVDGLDAMGHVDGALRVGATVRQRRVERDPRSRTVPLLTKALPFVGHRELRSRGTVCGSLAHADPAAELPAVASCLGASLALAGPRGSRTVDAADFFAGAMTTVIADDELLVAAEFPTARTGEGFGFAEIARRHGDFALAGVATRVRVEGDEVAAAVVTAFGVSDRPVTRDVRAVLALEAVGGEDLVGRLMAPFEELAREVVDTAGDGHGSTGYRRRLFAVLAARETAAAYTAAQEEGS